VIQKLTKDPGALVLVENEETVDGRYNFWDDITGVQYQYPNQYKNRVAPGLPFVYYRGVRRRSGRRGPAEYFGTGTIGEVRATEAVTNTARAHWCCVIEDYIAFARPVPARNNGRSYETIASGMAWRTCVRQISIETFHEILGAAGLDLRAPLLPATRALPDVCEAHIPGELLVPRSHLLAQPSGLIDRRSMQAKAVGDRAEDLVYRWLLKTLPQPNRASVDWVARRGLTPGWDIEYLDSSGSRKSIEVKGTALSRFAAVELTANEWRAAVTERTGFAIALVASVFSAAPRLALLWDPFGLAESRKMAATPTGWRLVKVDEILRYERPKDPAAIADRTARP
jgi:hypothetical protein